MKALRLFEEFATRLHPSLKSQSPGPEFDLSSADWSALRQLAVSKQIAVADSAWDADRKAMLQAIRMELARLQSGPEGRLKISIEVDPQVRAAVELLPRAGELLAAQRSR